MRARMLSRATALLLATLSTTAALTVGVSASASPSAPAIQVRCELTSSLYKSDTPTPRMVVEGDLGCEGSPLHVSVYRNGVQVISGGNSIGNLTFWHGCTCSDVAHWKAVWSTGAIDEGDFPCT